MLSQQPNQALKKQALAIFPPKDKADFQCVEGTRARLMEACTFVSRESLGASGMLGDLNKSLASSLDEVVTRTYMNEGMRKTVANNVQVHIKPYLNYMAGVSKDLVSQKDANYLLPKKYLSASSAHTLLTAMASGSTQETSGAKTILKNGLKDFFEQLQKNDFSPKSLDEIKHHPLMDLIKSFDEKFNLVNENYMEACAEGFDYQWNATKIFDDISTILNTHLLGRYLSESLSYSDAFKPEKRQEIIGCLTSNQPEKIEQSVNLLFVVGESFKDSSPAAFIHIMSEAGAAFYQANKHPDAEILREDSFAFIQKNKDINIPAMHFLIDLKIKCDANPQLSHLSEKIEGMIDRFNFYVGTPEKFTAHFKSYVNNIKNNQHFSYKNKAEAIFNKHCKIAASPLIYISPFSSMLTLCVQTNMRIQDDEERHEREKKRHFSVK